MNGPSYKPRPFRHKAVYEFTCLCGCLQESEQPEGRCPQCERAFEIHNWGGRASKPKNIALIHAQPPIRRDGL